MSQIGARSAYLALRDFDPANVSCGVKSAMADWSALEVMLPLPDQVTHRVGAFHLIGLRVSPDGKLRYCDDLGLLHPA
jgi:hypothetical protein